jgi:hypothetical protein
MKKTTPSLIVRACGWVGVSLFLSLYLGVYVYVYVALFVHVFLSITDAPLYCIHQFVSCSSSLSLPILPIYLCALTFPYSCYHLNSYMHQLNFTILLSMRIYRSNIAS